MPMIASRRFRRRIHRGLEKIRRGDADHPRDDDQIVPIGASALLSAKCVPNAILKIYPGGSHSLGDTSKDQLNADLLAFLKS
jgi:hypothetical protein